MQAEAPLVRSAADFFLREKGIQQDTLSWFGVTCEGDVASFPYLGQNALKHRRLPREFWNDKGFKPDLFMETSGSRTGTMFLCEGETDTMRLQQELYADAGGDAPTVLGLPGITNWKPEFARHFQDAEQVFVILDNDPDYNVRAIVDAAWLQIRNDIGRKAKRIKLDFANVKDVCEYFQAGHTTADLKKLVTQPASRFKPVDFRLPPPPVHWLLPGWIAQGDVTVLAGKGGLGKSWITMGLAMAVLNGEAEFLGMPVEKQGGVLYVDEENPIDVVYKRLLQLGLRPESSEGLRFLWNNGVRLDRDAADLLEEAQNLEPALFVLDSLSRMHSGAENDQSDMGKLINDGLKPLARETGAGVVIIHHHNQTGTNPRGSTDIVNAPDAVIEVYEEGPTAFRMVLTKSRRRARGATLHVAITDTEEGGVRLVTATEGPTPW